MCNTLLRGAQTPGGQNITQEGISPQPTSIFCSNDISALDCIIRENAMKNCGNECEDQIGLWKFMCFLFPGCLDEFCFLGEWF
jgi:hypothetical protein